MEFKFIKNLSKESADIYLYGEIGYDISAKEFVNELNYLSNSAQIPLINIRINSPGGSVIDGLGIFQAIRNSTSEVNTYIDGIAASMAGPIAMAGNKRYMVAHGTFMMHNVHPGGSVDHLPAEDRMKIEAAMQVMTDSLAMILSQNSGMELAEVKGLMDKETWLNATQALEMKLIDKIIDSTPKKRLAPNDLMAMANSIVKPKEITMKNVLKLLNLNENASEDAAVESVEALKEKVKNLETENGTLKTENEGFKTAKESAEAAKVEAEATNEVEAAITAGKLSADKKVELVASAKKDLTGFKNMIAAIPSVSKHVNLIEQLSKVKNVGGEDRSAWTIRDWDKKDPAGLRKIMNETPELYASMYDSYYRPDKVNN